MIGRWTKTPKMETHTGGKVCRGFGIRFPYAKPVWNKFAPEKVPSSTLYPK